MTESSKLAAYHEAGHAVIAKVFGLRVRRVSIDGVGRGECSHEPCGPYPELLICLAGIEAEARVLGFETWCAGFTDAEIVQRACGDLLRANALVETHPHLWPRAVLEVRRLIFATDVWTDISTLASQLLAAPRTRSTKVSAVPRA